MYVYIGPTVSVDRLGPGPGHQILGRAGPGCSRPARTLAFKPGHGRPGLWPGPLKTLISTTRMLIHVDSLFQQQTHNLNDNEEGA